MLASDDFLFVVDKTPLVAVDLIFVRNSGEVLLGQRRNRPASGFWFVPGGRIRKDEPIAVAMGRILATEVGLLDGLASAALVPQLLGAFEHFYDDCFAGECGVSTHYVVLGYRINVPEDFEPASIDSQHAAWRWWPVSEALASDEVHRFTKDYLAFLG